MNFLPLFESRTAERSVHHFKSFHLEHCDAIPIVGCIINSSLFYAWFIAIGNGRNVALRDIELFPVTESMFLPGVVSEFSRLFEKLMEDYQGQSVVRNRRDGVRYQEFYPARSKPIIDEIDRVLAAHYGFTAEELDFIVNYDIKYRMGRDGDAGAA